MDFDPVFWYWWIIGAILIGLEILLPGVYLLWLGLAAFLTGGVVLFLSDASFLFQATVFAVFSIATSLVGRWLYRHFMKKVEDNHLNQRGSELVERRAVLEQPIQAGRGRLSLGGTTWIIEGEDCPTGETVRVVACQGNILKVERVSSDFSS